MKTPLYRQALAHSWQLAKNHKLLWVYGLFATFLGQMGLLELIGKVGVSSSDYALHPKWLAFPKFCQYVASGFKAEYIPVEGWIWMVWLGVILLGLLAAFVFMSVLSQGALIHASAKSVKSKKLPDVGVAWHVGVSHFWRLFTLNLVKKLIMVILSVLVGFATLNFVVQESGWNLFVFLLAFLAVVLVGMVISFLVIYAAGYVVVEEYPLGKAVASAWKLFIDHWLVSIEVGLVILFMNVVLGLVVLFAFMVIFFPTLLAWLVASLTFSYWLYFIGLTLGVVGFTLFIILVGSLFTVYTTSVWTYLFMKMHKHGIHSRIMHWSGHISKKH